VQNLRGDATQGDGDLARDKETKTKAACRARGFHEEVCYGSGWRATAAVMVPVSRQVSEEGWLGSNDSETPAVGGSAPLRPQPPNPSLEP